MFTQIGDDQAIAMRPATKLRCQSENRARAPVWAQLGLPGVRPRKAVSTKV